MSGEDRSVSVGRDAVNSVITSGDGNVVNVFFQISAAVETRTAPAIGANPYRGLQAFTELDADRFFGREALVAQLWERFRDLSVPPGDAPPCRVLSVLGPSGSGKSSAVRAGLLAEFARRPLPGRDRQRVAVLTPGERPIEALAAVLARIATNDPAPVAKAREFADELRRRGDDGVSDGLRRIAAALPDIAREPLVILIDQFEEIYSLCRNAEERRAFVETLLDAAGDRAGTVSLIFTLRSDFLGATQADSELNQVIARQSVIIPAMSAAELRLAIAEPARRAGRPIDEDTVRRLVAETEGRPGALPLLQFILVRVWEGMAEDTPAAATVDALGGVGGALGLEAERLYATLSPSEQEIARRAFLAMVTFGDTGRPMRRRVPLSQLVAATDAADAGAALAEVDRVLDRFAQPESRLVTLAGARDGGRVAEVTHEAIFEHWPQLKDWLVDGREDILFHQRVAEETQQWLEAGRPAGSLWRPPKLDRLQAFAARNPANLSADERAFLDASAAAMAAEAAAPRRRQLVAGGVLAVLLVLQLAAPSLFTAPRLALFDSYQRWLPRYLARTASPVVLVAIDNESVKAEPWPWAREDMALLIGKIMADKPAAVGVNVFFAEPKAGDDVLAEALAGGRTVVALVGRSDFDGAVKTAAPRSASVDVRGGAATLAAVRQVKSEDRTLDELDMRAAGRGDVAEDPDPDGVYRRGSLISSMKGEVVPSMALELVRVLRGATSYAVLPRAFGQGVGGIAVGGRTIPTQADGSTWIDFRPREELAVVSALDVVRIHPRNWLANRVVIVGLTADGLGGLVNMPGGRRGWGSEVLMQQLENLLDRPAIRPAWAPPLEALSTAALGLLLILRLPRARGFVGVLAILAPLALLAALGLGAWWKGRLLIDVATPAIIYGLVFVTFFASLLDVNVRWRPAR